MALSATLGLAVQDSGVATRKTSASTKTSTAKAHRSAHASSQSKTAPAKTVPAKTSQAKGAPAHPRSTEAKAEAAKKAPAAVHHRAAAEPAKTASKSTHRRTSTASKKTAAVAARHYTQQQPTPERYKEIQQALADHGYFQGPVDGTWGADSTEALKRFQHDQNIADDGKIGSLSLIALGLGPKRAARTELSPEKSNQYL